MQHAANLNGHSIRSSNLPYYAAVWEIAKQCRGLVGMKKKFYWIPGDDRPVNKSCGKVPKGSRDKKYSAEVDIVAQDGLKWIKVCTISSKKLLFEIAKNGWTDDSDDDDDEEDAMAWMANDDDEEQDGLLAKARSLVKAANATRIRHQFPSIHMVLPRIKRGKVKEIDRLLKVIESLGITIDTEQDIQPAPQFNRELMVKMAVDPFADLTDILNVDCTMLLAFASDLSHMHSVDEKDWHIAAIRKQIQQEQKNHLLPSSLWPVCGSRKLVCTRESATRMDDIVQLIGTPNEKLRARYLMDIYEPMTQEERIKGFQSLCDYEVPTDWALPIITVDISIPDIEKELPTSPEIISCLKQELLPINQSIFFYGWAKGLTTITSNGAVAKRIQSTIDEFKKIDGGLRMWICPTSRSLLAKEKVRRGCKATDKQVTVNTLAGSDDDVQDI